MRAKSLRLSGWGRSSYATVSATRPERVEQTVAAIGKVGKSGIIAHGGGRSYGDAALNDGGGVLLSERLNRFIAFDPNSGVLVAEPGVTFRDLLKVFLPRGYLAPVSPGTAFVTLGGALANDVHGKNHDFVGSFGDHVQWLDLLLPSGEIARVSPSQDKALFEATVGGIGLTGIILAIALRLERVPSNAVHRVERRISNIEAFLQAFDEVPRGEMVYSVAWIDGLATGRSLGRGILEIATPAETNVTHAARRPLSVPVDLPGIALNSWSVGAFNEAYFRRIPNGGRERNVPYDRFLYPLDGLANWNKLYGKNGFYQFQCVLPQASTEAGLPRLLEQITRSRKTSFLAVLKTLGGPGRGCLSFPMKGHTLALDFPRRPGVEELLDQLERITLDYGGRIYLAKDSRLSAKGFAEMYPRRGELLDVLERVDAEGRMTSDMARRLEIRGKGAKAP